jgi:peptidoglycan/LPS O-acetylase OafA/YrhL
VNRFLKIFGIALLLSGLAHSAGVAHFYTTTGVPDANRVLLDIWIAEGLLLGGSLYLAAWNASRAGQSPRVLTIFGSLMIIGFTAPMTPVLLSRAPIHFVMLTVIYLLLSVFILARAARPGGNRSR